MTGLQTEVCVVGGGPAGACAAMRLAALGHRVCLVERRAFPRRHVGESLSPGIVGLLEQLGVWERVRSAALLRRTGARVRWGEGPLEQREEGTWLLVDRGELDSLLLEVVRERGVQVLQPAAARAARQEAEGWRLRVEVQGGAAVEVVARLLVDASGRAGFLPGRRQAWGPRMVALHGYLHGEALPDSACVEAGPEGWYWGAPLPSGCFSAMVFVDPESLPPGGCQALEPLLRGALARSELLAACAEAPLLGRVRARDATCQADTAPIGQSWLKLGEAGFTLDPLSSTGVEKALRMSLVGSAVAHTLLVCPERAELAVRFYTERQRESLEQHTAWTAAFYQQPQRYADRPFWRRRAGSTQVVPASTQEPAAALLGPETLHCPVALSSEALFVETPCLVGELIASRPALHHPALARPVAFLQGLELAPLVRMIAPGEPLHHVVRRWALQVPLRQALATATWLLEQGILVTQGARTGPAGHGSLP